MSKNKGKRFLPSTVELFRSTRNPVALAAIMRSGAGKHADKRRATEHKRSWKNEAWT